MVSPAAHPSPRGISVETVVRGALRTHTHEPVQFWSAKSVPGSESWYPWSQLQVLSLFGEELLSQQREHVVALPIRQPSPTTTTAEHVSHTQRTTQG